MYNKVRLVSFSQLDMDSGQLTTLSDFNILETEYFYWQSYPTNFKIIGMTVAIIIIIINVILLKYIIQEHSLTFFNQMVIADCILCLANVPAVLRLSVVRMSSSLCWFFPTFGFFINIFNRLLSNAIMFYRYVFVLHSSLVQTPRQRAYFSATLSLVVFSISLSLAAFSLFYRENSLHYLGMDKLINPSLVNSSQV